MCRKRTWIHYRCSRTPGKGTKLYLRIYFHLNGNVTPSVTLHSKPWDTPKLIQRYWTPDSTCSQTPNVLRRLFVSGSIPGTRTSLVPVIVIILFLKKMWNIFGVLANECSSPKALSLLPVSECRRNIGICLGCAGETLKVIACYDRSFRGRWRVFNTPNDTVMEDDNSSHIHTCQSEWKLPYR